MSNQAVAPGCWEREHAKKWRSVHLPTDRNRGETPSADRLIVSLHDVPECTHLTSRSDVLRASYRLLVQGSNEVLHEPLDDEYEELSSEE